MIAFAYCNTGPKTTALYTALCEGLTKNIRQIVPGEEIMLITDENTPAVSGVNSVLRIERHVPLMTWRLKCHQLAHTRADEIIFVEPDVRFVEDISSAFSGEFDVAVTSREQEVLLDNERLNTPFTLGMTFSRSPEFWREAKLFCQTLDEKDQNWFGDMLAIAHVIDGGKFNVKTLDGADYNHVMNDPSKPTTAKVLHYKGKRKAFLFPQASEAA